VSTVVIGAGWAFLCAGWYCEIAWWRRKIEHFWAAGLFTACNALYTAWFMLDGDAGYAVFSAACMVITAALFRYYWKRRKRRGRLAAAGAKSRARIAAMVTRMRERPARPVLRPVPAGAPWGPPGSDWRLP